MKEVAVLTAIDCPFFLFPMPNNYPFNGAFSLTPAGVLYLAALRTVRDTHIYFQLHSSSYSFLASKDGHVLPALKSRWP